MDDGNSVRLTLGDLFLLVFPKVTLYEHLPWILFAQNFLIIADIQITPRRFQRSSQETFCTISLFLNNDVFPPFKHFTSLVLSCALKILNVIWHLNSLPGNEVNNAALPMVLCNVQPSSLIFVQYCLWRWWWWWCQALPNGAIITRQSIVKYPQIRRFWSRSEENDSLMSALYASQNLIRIISIIIHIRTGMG